VWVEVLQGDNGRGQFGGQRAQYPDQGICAAKAAEERDHGKAVDERASEGCGRYLRTRAMNISSRAGGSSRILRTRHGPTIITPGTWLRTCRCAVLCGWCGRTGMAAGHESMVHLIGCCLSRGHLTGPVCFDQEEYQWRVLSTMRQ
jgi:hypothetical protein